LENPATTVFRLEVMAAWFLIFQFYCFYAKWVLSVSPAEVTIGHITVQPHNIIQMLYALKLVKVCLEAITSTPQTEAVVSSKALVSNPRRVLPGIPLNLKSNKRHS
jgi:hypothetical protein